MDGALNPQQGVGPATVGGPAPTQGASSAALAKVALAVRILESTIPELGSGSEAGLAVLKAVQGLSKVAHDQGSAGTAQTALMQLMMQQRQEAPMLAQLKQQQMQRALAAGGGQAAGAAPAAAPPTPAAPPEGGGDSGT